MDRQLDNGYYSPTRKRRFAALIYEAMLLFGVVFMAAYLFDTLTQSKHALMLRHERQAWLFFVLGVYFVWFWRHGGQTLAMKTWHIRLIREDGHRITLIQGMLRYVLCYLFTLSGVAFVYSFFDKNGQFPQDRLLGTLLVSTQSRERGVEKPLKA